MESVAFLASASEAMVASSILPAMISYFLQILSLYSYSKLCQEQDAKLRDNSISTAVSVAHQNNTDGVNCGSADEKHRVNSLEIIRPNAVNIVNVGPNSNLSTFELLIAEIFVVFAITCLLYSAAFQFQHFVGVLFVVITTVGKCNSAAGYKFDALILVLNSPFFRILL